jgi:hypothetical protein
MDTLVNIALLPPGDLSGWELAALAGTLIAFGVLPIVVIGFNIYRVVTRHSRQKAAVVSLLNHDGDLDP